MKRILILSLILTLITILTGCTHWNENKVTWDVDIYVRNTEHRVISFKIDGQTLNIPPNETYKVTIHCVEWTTSPNPLLTEPGYDDPYNYPDPIENRSEYTLSYEDGTAGTNDTFILTEGIGTIQVYVFYSEEYRHLVLGTVSK